MAKIAGEKAGIIKRGRPVVSGADQASARRVIAEVASRRRSKLFQLGRDFQARHEASDESLAPGSLILDPPRQCRQPLPLALPLGMRGRHQAANAALATVAAMLLPSKGFPVGLDAITRGLAMARLPARIEVLAEEPKVIVDAAHNVASMESLVSTVGEVLERVRPRVLVFGSSRDKPIVAMLEAARGLFDHVVITRSTCSPRAASIESLATACREARLPVPKQADHPAAALALARRLAGRRGVIVAAGSFFLAGEIRDAAGVIRPQ